MSNGDHAPSDIPHPDESRPAGSSDDRTPLMAIPEVRQLSDALIENGYGDVVDKTEAFLEIDTTAMKVAALTKYGVPEQGSRPVAPPKGTSPFDVANLDPDQFIIRNAPNTLSLEEFAVDLLTTMTDFTENRWQGPAFEEFSSYVDEVHWVVKREGERLRTIGQALFDLTSVRLVRTWGSDDERKCVA